MSTPVVTLSDEHVRYAFVTLAEGSKRVLWATQRAAIAALRDEVLSGSPGGAAREVTARLATHRATPRTTTTRRPAARRRRA